MPPKPAIRDPQVLDDLVTAVLATKNVAEAARSVGTSPAAAWRVVSSPEFLTALQVRTRARLQVDAVDALEYLATVFRDPSQATTNRVNAARMVAMTAGYVPPKAAEPARTATNPAEMTSDQLRRQVEEIERELSQRAEPVAAQSVQVTDLLE